jgi:hypothetical protein
MRKFYILIFIIIGLGLVACTGDGISGSASGSSLNYHYSDEGGNAEGGYNKITGTYPAEFEVSIFNDDYISVDNLTVSVETGRLRVYLKESDGTISEVYIEPGQTGSLNGLAEVWADETFRIYFDAIDGEALGIIYSMNFSYE